jgi:hypothetical protein
MRKAELLLVKVTRLELRACWTALVTSSLHTSSASSTTV